MLTIQMVCDSSVAGLPYTTLNGWMKHGAFTPAVPGSPGRGNAALFSKMQAIGLCVAAELTRQPRGCNAKYVQMIVRAFGKMPEADLLKAFEEDRTGFVMVSGGDLVLDVKKYDRVDVKKAYARVKESCSGPGRIR